MAAFVDGKDGFFYGIPYLYNARRVVKFNPLDKSLTEIFIIQQNKCFERPEGKVTPSQNSVHWSRKSTPMSDI